MFSITTCISAYCIGNPEITQAISLDKPRMKVGADHPVQESPSGHVAKLLQLNAATSALLVKWAHKQPRQTNRIKNKGICLHKPSQNTAPKTLLTNVEPATNESNC
jgi:hypothetical protein